MYAAIFKNTKCVYVCACGVGGVKSSVSQCLPWSIANKLVDGHVVEKGCYSVTML